MKVIQTLLAVIFAAVCTVVAAAQASHPLLQRPAFNGTLIVFSYAGDLWTVDRNGGQIPPYSETMAYVPRVLKVYRMLVEQPRST